MATFISKRRFFHGNQLIEADQEIQIELSKSGKPVDAFWRRRYEEGSIEQFVTKAPLAPAAKKTSVKND